MNDTVFHSVGVKNRASTGFRLYSTTSMPSLRRFAIVAPNFYPRVCGVGDHTARLGAELQRRGHEVRIFSRQPAERHPEMPALEVHGAEGRWPTPIARHLMEAITEYRPTDVLI